MPTFIVKPKPDEDFYVAWSTVVDAPTAHGTRAELEACPWLDTSSGRFGRADERGTSMNDPILPADQQWFGWHTAEWMIREVVPHRAGGVWVVSRENLRSVCEGIDAGADVTGLLRFETHEEA